MLILCMQKVFLTTPIFYPNDKPHLGHAYTSVLTDFMARFYSLHGYNVKFSTGLDEHGQKIAKTSAKLGITPKEHVDNMLPYFMNMMDIYNISYDVFVRTTSDVHKQAVIALWNKIYDNGYIELSTYHGWYNVSDEAFVKESDIAQIAEDNLSGTTHTGQHVIWLEEECYFFKLSKFQERLQKFYEEHEDAVYPVSRLNEVKAFLKEPLLDIAVSRTTIDWGIDVPCQEECKKKHVVYVWLDALTNYLTALKYPEDVDWEMWNHSVHVLGKDILRFHAVYWPAMLWAADLQAPSKIISHGWWLSVKDEKMSKSLGNVVDPIVLTEDYDAEMIRWFFLREMTVGADGHFSQERLIIRWNELANTVGNLVHRSTTLLSRKFDGKMLVSEDMFESEKFVMELEQFVKRGRIELYTQEIMEYAFKVNKYFDEQAPWKMEESAQQVLSNVIYAVKMLGVALLPVVPERAQKMLDLISVEDKSLSGFEAGHCVQTPTEVLFQKRV